MTDEEYEAVVEQMKEIDASIVCVFRYASAIMWAIFLIALTALCTCTIAVTSVMVHH